MSRKNKESKESKHEHTPKVVFGEFIRTFTFSDQPQLPIVQPGRSLIFPIPTVRPSGVTYVEEDSRVGLLVPRGTYLISWNLNPDVDSSVVLLVNGQRPLTVSTPLNPINFPYTQLITTGVVNAQHLIKAPLKRDNLISLVNNGSFLLTLGDIPNTKIGPTSVITHIRVQRIAKK